MGLISKSQPCSTSYLPNSWRKLNRASPSNGIPKPPLSRFGALTAILHGADDPIPLASSQAAAAALGADLTVLEACGHVPYVERREACIAALRAYLRTVTRGPEPGAP